MGGDSFIFDFAGMIMGAAGSTVFYNLRLRHPTMDLPIIDYDLALLFQPMLMLGISIGVTFSVIFADWMVTVLLIVLFLGTKDFHLSHFDHLLCCKGPLFFLYWVLKLQELKNCNTSRSSSFFGTKNNQATFNFSPPKAHPLL